MEERLFIAGEQVVTPVNRISHRLLPRRDVAGASREQRQSLLQAEKERLRWKEPDEGRGKLNGQREAIEPAANLDDGRGVGRGDREVGLHGLRPLDKEAHRIDLEHPLERRQVSRIRQQERRKRVLLLTIAVQRRAAGDEDLHSWRPSKEIANEGRRLEDTLEIVEHQQQPLSGEHPSQAFHQ
jgi:hypothetical protein